MNPVYYLYLPLWSYLILRSHPLWSYLILWSHPLWSYLILWPYPLWSYSILWSHPLWSYLILWPYPLWSYLILWPHLILWLYPYHFRIFGFVARKQSNVVDNACHLFAEIDPEQPASAIVSFVTKVMIGQAKTQQKSWLVTILKCWDLTHLMISQFYANVLLIKYCSCSLEHSHFCWYD